MTDQNGDLNDSGGGGAGGIYSGVGQDHRQRNLIDPKSISENEAPLG
jgi:hypothetical protein